MELLGGLCTGFLKTNPVLANGVYGALTIEPHYPKGEGSRRAYPLMAMLRVHQVDKLLHGKENMVGADAGYTGVEKRPAHEDREVIWQITASRSTYKTLSKRSALYKTKRKIEKA